MLSRALCSAILLLPALAIHAQSAKSIGSFAAPPVQRVFDTTIAWANPLEGGKLRILFIAPQGAMRDADALAERLECDLDRVALPARASGLAGTAVDVVEAADVNDNSAPAPEVDPQQDETPNAWVDTMRAALQQRPSVIVIGNVEIAGLPADLQDSIVALVQGGVGLFLSNVLLDGGPLDNFLGQLNPAHDATKQITAGAAAVPIQSEKPLANFLHAVENETARAVVVDGPGDPPLTHALLPPPPDGVYLEDTWREDAWSLMLRGLRWTARRDPEAMITGMADTSPKGPNEEEIPPDLPQEFVQSMRDAAFNLPLHPISVQLSAPLPRDAEATFQLRRRGEARRAYTTSVAIEKGAMIFGTQLLINPGEFEVDCLLHGRKGIADWFTLPVSVPGWPEAERIEADKAFLLPNDTLVLTAQVRPVFGVSRAGTLYARALDPAGELLAESTLSVDSNGGPAELQIAFADLLTPMVVVELYAFEGDARRYAAVELASTGAHVLRFPVRQWRRAPHFEIVVDAPYRDEFNARWYLEKWAAHGGGTLYTGGGSAAIVRAAELGLSLLPAVADYAPTLRENRTRPCLSDPAFLAKERARIKDDAAQYWAGGGGAHLLGWPAWHAHGEGDTNPCQSDTCVAAFRDWLARHYVDINALNAAWGASWPSFDEVAPPHLADCQKANIPAPWMNWRMSMDDVFAKALASAQGTLLDMDQNAVAGAGLLDDADARRGYDLAALSQSIGFVSAPPAFAAAEKLRAYRTQAQWGGVVAPALDTPAQGRWIAWHALLQQAPAVWIHDAVPSAFAHAKNPAFSNGGDFTEPYEALADAVERIDEGAGAVVLAASRARSGIAVLDSRAARLATDVDMAFGAYLDAQDAWVALLRRQGFDFTFITGAQAAQGALEPYRAVVLPHALALDVAEAAAIAKFAQQGGALLSDLAPGIYTALGARNEVPLLDEWFGISHTAAPSAKEAPLETLNVVTDASLALTDATAGVPGDVPLHLGIDKEKHHALLLNYIPAKSSGPWDAAAGAFLLANGCARAVELVDANAKVTDHLTRVRFRYGQAEILALLATADAPDKLEARVALSEAQHVFNLSDRDAVERARKSRVVLHPGEAAVLALLPYEVTELRVEAAAIVQQGKRLNFACMLRARKGEVGKHLVRVTLAPAGGAPIPAYTQHIECESGAGGGYIPVRQGQAPGLYTFRAEDLLSGTSFSHDVKVVGLSAQ